MPDNNTPINPLSSNAARRIASLWAIGFVAALVLYAGTANRGVQWQDSGWQQYRIASGTIEHARGLALTHPLQYYLGRIAIAVLPFEPAFCTTLVSVFAASITIGNLLVLLTLATRRVIVAAICTTAFLLSHTFWQMATHTESYTLVIALLSAEWLCLLGYARTTNGRWLLGVGLFNGLGIANHMLATLALPVDLVVIAIAIRKRQLAPRIAASTAVLWLIGTLPYTLLVLQTAIETGDLAGTVHSALFGSYSGSVLNTTVGVRLLILSLGYILYNFPGLTVPLAAHAAFRKVDAPRLFVIAVRCQLAIFFVFVVRYSIVDQFTFYLPVYGLLTVLAGIGLSDCLRRSKPRVAKGLMALALLSAVWPPIIYAATESVLASKGALKSLVGNKPYRDGYAAFFTPWSVGQNHAEVLNNTAFETAGPNGVIVLEDGMMWHALRYRQNFGDEPDQIEVIRAYPSQNNDELTKLKHRLHVWHSTGRAVVLVPRDRDAPRTFLSACTWERRGDLYVLREIDPHGE